MGCWRTIVWYNDGTQRGEMLVVAAKEIGRWEGGKESINSRYKKQGIAMNMDIFPLTMRYIPWPHQH